MKFFNEVEKKQNFKGKSTFWEFSFCIQKRPLIINITAFLLKKSFHAFFSFLMCSNLGLFPQNWGLSTEHNGILNMYL